MMTDEERELLVELVGAIGLALFRFAVDVKMASQDEIDRNDRVRENRVQASFRSLGRTIAEFADEGP